MGRMWNGPRIHSCSRFRRGGAKNFYLLWDRRFFHIFSVNHLEHLDTCRIWHLQGRPDCWALPEGCALLSAIFLVFTVFSFWWENRLFREIKPSNFLKRLCVSEWQSERKRERERERTDSIHPSSPLRTCSRLRECITIISPSYPPFFSEQIMSVGADWNDFEFSKATNPWEDTCSCKPQMYRCLISKDSSPPLFLSFFLSFLSHFLPSPLWLQLYPSTELEAYWNTSPWSSLHFKVDFRPRARPEGKVRPVNGPAPE